MMENNNFLLKITTYQNTQAEKRRMFAQSFYCNEFQFT